VSTVPLWSGREVRALREARRMSVREFAAHLGVSDRMVSKWEAGGEGIRPRPLNQSALDTSLALADADVKTRFTHIAVGQDVPLPRRRSSATPKLVPEQAVHFVRHPLDSKLMTLIDSGPFRLGAGRKPVWLPGYYVDVQPTTNAEYARFLAATGRRPPPHWPDGRYTIADDPEALHDDPVSDLSFSDACAYARWAAKELISAVQWDRAIRGAEGATTADIWEWVRAESGAGRRGHKGAQTGGFRCTSPAAQLLSLLAI
jgi:formylglycine-generating enzyme required for sulfatase activity